MSDRDSTLVEVKLEAGDRVNSVTVLARNDQGGEYIIERDHRVVEDEPNLTQVRVARSALTRLRRDLGLSTYIALKACIDTAALHITRGRT